MRRYTGRLDIGNFILNKKDKVLQFGLQFTEGFGS